MQCPKCEADSRVSETRAISGNSRRRRHCNNVACGHRFTTIEAIVGSTIKHNDVVVMIMPRASVAGIRSILALLDRGLAGDLSQDLRRDGGGTDAEHTEHAEDDPLTVLPPAGLENR